MARHFKLNCFGYPLGWTGLFCPCVLFGRNIETLKGDISERAACIGHVICVEGGLTAAAVTSVLHGIDPQTMCLIYEGLFFAWWMCGIYTSMARQSVQKKYHLKVMYLSFIILKVKHTHKMCFPCLN